jgi:hypothetical protein
MCNDQLVTGPQCDIYLAPPSGRHGHFEATGEFFFPVLQCQVAAGRKAGRLQPDMSLCR